MSEGEAYQIPPSPIHRFEFDDGDVEVFAKFAKWIPGDPAKLHTFGATEIDTHGVELLPPSSHEEGSDYRTLRAFYTGDESNVIVYYWETWGADAVNQFVAAHVVFELHELAHWAVPEEDNEVGSDHWEPWNTFLAGVVDYVMDVEWTTDPYEPPEPPKPERRPARRQATLEEVVHQ